MSSLNHNPIIKNIPLKDIKPYSNNPRKKQNITKVVNSIKEFGFQQPIVVDKKNIIIVGHSRYEAGKELGLDKVPVIIADLSPVKAKAYRIADNRINQDSEWDFSKLKLEFKDISKLDFNLDSLGFEKNELDDLIIDEVKGFTDDDAVPELPKEPNAKLGDIYKLREHRLMCGDSTNSNQVKLLMNGHTAKLLHADPPYGMGKEKDGVLNDNLYKEKLDNFQMAWWKTFRPHLENNASSYIWGNSEDLWRLWFSGGLGNSERITFRNEIVWSKKNAQGIGSKDFRMFPTATERAIFFMLGEQGFNNNFFTSSSLVESPHITL